MINSISSQNYTVQQAYSQTNTSNVEHPVISNTKASNAVAQHDSRKSALSFIENASLEEATARVNALTGRMPSAAMINLNEILNSDRGFEIAERIGRLQGQLKQEHRNVLNLEQDIINQGRADGKSDKEILLSIVQMQDEQSDLYKMSISWGTKGLTSPENYAKLVELTPSYVNYYA